VQAGCVLSWPADWAHEGVPRSTAARRPELGARLPGGEPGLQSAGTTSTRSRRVGSWAVAGCLFPTVWSACRNSHILGWSSISVAAGSWPH